MITDVISPATFASPEATHPANPQISVLLPDYAMALGMMESFWGRMQTELLNRKKWEIRIELANAIFDYLEIFHNRQRRHSSLGMLTPNEYERLHTTPVGRIEPAVTAP